MNFRVGQKVVYVGGISGHECKGLPPTLLRKGQICTIREIDQRYLGPYGYLGIRTEEEVRCTVRWNGLDFEPAIASIKFRPVIEKKTDTGMAILREILDRETIKDAPRVPQKQT